MLLLLAAYRNEDAATSPFLKRFQAAMEAAGPLLDRRVLTVEPLSQAEAEVLALQLIDRDGQAAQVHAKGIALESGGNPFFVQELARQIRSEPSAGPDVTRNVGLDDMLWKRIQELSEGARRLLELVAVFGRPLPEAVACQAAELGAEGRAASALLRSGRLIRSTGATGGEDLETYHDRIREAIVARLAPAVKRRHHHLLGEALEASGSPTPRSWRSTSTRPTSSSGRGSTMRQPRRGRPRPWPSTSPPSFSARRWNCIRPPAPNGSGFRSGSPMPLPAQGAGPRRRGSISRPPPLPTPKQPSASVATPLCSCSSAATLMNGSPPSVLF